MSFIKKSLIAAAFTGCMHIARKVTLGGLFGTLNGYFSLAHCTAPLLGFFSTSVCLLLILFPSNHTIPRPILAIPSIFQLCAEHSGSQQNRVFLRWSYQQSA